LKDKISLLAVIKEASSITWDRKWVLLLVFAACLVVAMGFQFLPVLVPGMHWSLFSIGVAGMMLSQLVALVVCCHLVVMHMRGVIRIIPEHFGSRLWQSAIRGVLFLLVVGGVWLLGVRPMFFMGANTEWVNMDPAGGTSFIAMGGWFLFVFVAVITLALRLSVMFPGASVGHVLSLKEAWRMTDGHSWRMFGSYALVELLVMVVGGVLAAPFSIEIADGRFGVVGSSMLVMAICVWLFGAMLTAVLLPVWYERLRLWHEENNAEVDA